MAAISLMMLDRHVPQTVQPLRSTLLSVTVPIYYFVQGPKQLVEKLHTYLLHQHEIQQINSELRNQLVMLQGKLQKLHRLELENEQLRALWKAMPGEREHFTLAELIAVSPESSTQQIVLNRGSNEGVLVGQPVLDAYGVVGQVIQVSKYISQVMLITDTQSAIPVQIVRNNLRAVAVGEGRTGNLQLLHLPVATDIRVGDEAISSGLGARYPVGYPVGKVIAVEHTLDEPFLQVTLQPTAKLQQSRLFLLVRNNVTGEQDV